MRFPRMAVAFIALCVVLLGVYVVDGVYAGQDVVPTEVTDCPDGVCAEPAVAGAVYRATGSGCGTSAAVQQAAQGRRARVFRQRRGPIRTWVARAFGARSSCGG